MHGRMLSSKKGLKVRVKTYRDTLISPCHLVKCAVWLESHFGIATSKSENYKSDAVIHWLPTQQSLKLVVVVKTG